MLAYHLAIGQFRANQIEHLERGRRPAIDLFHIIDFEQLVQDTLVYSCAHQAQVLADPLISYPQALAFDVTANLADLFLAFFPRAWMPKLYVQRSRFISGQWVLAQSPADSVLC